MNEIDRTTELMEVLGAWHSSLRKVPISDIACSWKPKSEAEINAIAELTSAQHRSQLRHWYAQVSTLNPVANAVHEYLERQIGEALPLKH